MDVRKVFCEECRNDVEYKVTTKLMEGNIKGEAYTYVGKEACCLDCGEKLYVSEINDYNLKILYNSYREKKGIISLETILAIPEKYAIGKRPLSILLGWGEQTFSRYCDGDMPTKQYSRVLEKIYDEPTYYYEILENNKGNLKTLASYEKSLKAVISLIEANTLPKRKIDLSIEYLLCKCEDITPLALQKALYYIQGFYYAFYGVFLFEEDCQAWVHGPVYRDVYFRYKEYRFDPIGADVEMDSSVFSSSEKTILDSVIKNICCYSGKVLERFTHAESPWIATRGNLSEDSLSDRIILKEEIGSYFSCAKEKYKMINPNDIKDYAQVMFEQMK